jgi:hypothetical protein
MPRNNGTNHLHTVTVKQVYAGFFINLLAMCWHKKLLSMSWHSSLTQKKLAFYYKTILASRMTVAGNFSGAGETSIVLMLLTGMIMSRPSTSTAMLSLVRIF